MECPRCTNDGKPTKMRRDVLIIGGASTLSCQDGIDCGESIHFYTCWKCGEHADIEIKPMDIEKAKASPEIKQPGPPLTEEQKQRKAAEKAEKTAGYLRKLKRSEDLKAVVDKNINLIRKYRELGVAFNKIAMEISTKKVPVTSVWLNKEMKRREGKCKELSE